MIRATLLSCLWLAAACSSPPPEPYSSAELAEARRLYQASDFDAAWDEITDWERDYFDRLAQGEYSLLAGDIAYARDDWDEAIQNYEEFLLFQGSGSESARAEDRLFELGMDLLEERRKVLGIFPDKSRGAVTLLNLATWSPRSPRSPEALAQVGEYHFRSRSFRDAADDYRTLLRFHPLSEWSDLAAFRLGMCGLGQIDGPWVSGELIRQSLNQLREYLSQYPSGLYRREAEEAAARLEELAAGHELLLGDYYREIDNPRGARRHYRAALSYSGTESAARAEQHLAELPAEDPSLPGPPPPEEG